MATYADANPWHVCFAIGLSWGNLAKFQTEFTGAAVSLLRSWNDEDLRLARTFHYERGPEPIEQSLRGAHILFSRVTLPPTLPDTLERLKTVLLYHVIARCDRGNTGMKRAKLFYAE
jgi:hypothetical protein